MDTGRGEMRYLRWYPLCAELSARRYFGVFFLESHGFLLDPVRNCNMDFAESSIPVPDAPGWSSAEGNVFSAGILCGSGCIPNLYAAAKYSVFDFCIYVKEIPRTFVRGIFMKFTIYLIGRTVDL